MGNKTSKKVFSAALTASTALYMSGVMAFLAPAAYAQSSADLQAQIQALLAQIAQLQAQLGAPSGGAPSGTTMMAKCTFTRSLTVGSRGNDVKCLQEYLNEEGFTIAASGPGSPGNETTYFGPRTRAAVAKWQAAKGISPASGYFGPISRAKYAEMTAGVMPPVTPPKEQPSVIPPPATGLTVSLAADNPPAGSLISGTFAAARVPVLKVNFTAGSAGGVTVNDVAFRKVGVLADSSISSAYLVEGGRVIGQYSSLSGGVLRFTGMNMGINAGQTRSLTLAIDVATGLSPGNTVSFALSSASDIAAVDNTNTAVTVTGSFPLNGNIFTVTSVSNPSLADVTVSSSSIGTSVYAGTQNVLVSQWTLTVTNSPVDLRSINFRVIGSANKADLKNVKLYVNNTQVGPTLTAVSGDGTAFFDLSASPARLNTGSSNLQVYADVMGSPSYNFQFSILNTYDVEAIDTQYNVPVSVKLTGGAGVQVSILQGQLTVSLATNTPTGNIAKGGSGTPLARFAIYAAGESVRVKFLTFRLDFTGATGTLSTIVKNISLVDDAGNQVGTTINTPPTSNSCDQNGTPTPANYSSGQYLDCFGTSSSNINYVIPANTTRVLTLKADIQPTASFSTITAQLIQSANNLQGLTSSQFASSGSVAGSALSLAASALTVSRNTAFGSPNYSPGSTDVRIGSYSLTASSADGVNLNSITILTSAASTNFQNLKLKVAGQQFGITQPTLSASASYTFSGSLNIPAGQTKIVDVFADILSSTSAGTYTTVTTLSGCSGSGATTFNSVTCASTSGQNIVIGGQATLRVAIDSATPAARQIVMGSTGNILGIYRFTEISNVEAVKITDLTVFQQVAATNTVKSAFGNVGIYDSAGTLLASAGAATTAASTSNPGPGYLYTFNFANPVVVPQAGSVSLVLKADVSTYSASGATDNTTHVFKIATSTEATNDTPGETVVALGNTSNATSAISLATGSAAPHANAVTVLRTKLSVTAAGIGATSGRAKQSVDDFADLTFTADAAGDVAINSVIITFSGSAPSIATFLDGVLLRDVANAQDLGTGNTTSSPCNGSNTCTKTFNLGSTTSGFLISAGTSKVFRLRIDSTKTLAATANVAQTLTATVNANTDIRYTNGTDSAATTGVSLPANAVPIPLNAVSYAVGT